ncbi:MAG: GFA family protein [Hyphomicrobiaceae bacterium]
MSDKRTGSCMCGQLHYEVPREMKTAAVCHCLMCQKSTGAGAMTTAVYADEDVKITGDSKTFTYTSDNGRPVTNRFCPNCGTSVTMVTPALPGLTLIRAGTLDDSTGLEPQFVVYNKRRPAWSSDNPNIPHFPEMPPA